MDMSDNWWTIPEIHDGTPTRYGWTVRHPDRLTLGHHTDIGYGTYIQAEHDVIIEDYAQIGGGVMVYSVSTIDGKKGVVRICHHACVGANSVVMPNVIIGAGAIVGALSFVNRSIPAWQVWGGNPIRYIKDVEDLKREKNIGLGK
jgi:acetyltransferase-like isoleucine patch superfamily enzyme